MHATGFLPTQLASAENHGSYVSSEQRGKELSGGSNTLLSKRQRNRQRKIASEGSNALDCTAGTDMVNLQYELAFLP